MKSILLIVLIMLLNSCSKQIPSATNLQLPNFFSNNMVLQRDLPIPIWGKADENGIVLIKFGEQEVSTVVDRSGNWTVELAPERAGGPFDMMVIGKDTMIISNIMIGEVWICAGQSNMGWPLIKSQRGEEALKTAGNNDIRLFTVGFNAALEPQEDVSGKWDLCTAETAADFSAAAFYFGRKLYQELKVPIGLIETQWGGTPAEAWMTRETIQRDSILQPILEKWDNLAAQYPDYVENFAAYHKKSQEEFYGQILEEYWKNARDLMKKGLPRPPVPERYPGDRKTPEVLYNAMLKPLVPLAISGVFWYQGEANTPRGFQYKSLFSGLIRDWREAWQRPELPFIFVQLPLINKLQSQPVERSYRAEVREAQLYTYKNMNNTGIAITIETGEEDNNHPLNKHDVGLRGAYWALADVYGMNIVKSGPIYSSASFLDNKVVLSFDFTGEGLQPAAGDELKGFAIAGPDSVFVWANAKIEGDNVYVWSDLVPNPIAVRYSWADHPVGNLVNSAGLPASPFCTDDWPWISEKNLSPF